MKQAIEEQLRAAWVLLWAALLFFSGSAQGKENSAETWLRRMATALRTLDYEGILVYAQGTRLKTLHVVHRLEDGRIQERLESLSAPARTVVREQGRITCHLQGDQSISIDGRSLYTSLFFPQNPDLQTLAPYYFFHMQGQTRVAGRLAQVVGIIPRDDFRYGYRFFIDQESSLPLKFDLLDTQANPIEQMLFATIAFKKVSSAPPPSPAPAPPPTPVDPRPWQFSKMPPGFQLVMIDRSSSLQAQKLVHFLLSDGLAAVSVYIEPGEEKGLIGESQLGAIHAAGKRIQGHQVTVVGEVPRKTVRAVLAGLIYEETP